MERTQQGRKTKRVQVCLTETEFSVFREIASKIMPNGDARGDGVDQSGAARQAILDWIRANGHVLQNQDS